MIQTENDYDKDVFNGDIGQIVKIDPVEREVTIRFDQREVLYDFGELDEISLAYAITIHKSQGSEFPAIVTPQLAVSQRTVSLARKWLMPSQEKLILNFSRQKSLVRQNHSKYCSARAELANYNPGSGELEVRR